MADVIELSENKKINIFEEIFNSIDNVNPDNPDSTLQLFSSILTLPEDKFKEVEPALLASFEKTFIEPEAKLSFIQMMNMNGLKIEDLTDNFNNLVDAIGNMTEANLSEEKKDFIKRILAIFVNTLSESQGAVKRIIQIPIELCRENAKLPTYATLGSAAMDLYSTEDVTINPGETKLIHLGIKVNIPKGYALLIQPRSGMSLKTKIRVPNTPGLIDSDYHEEICLIVENIENHIKDSRESTNKTVIAPIYGSSFTVSKGERCAQMRLVEVPMVNWLEVKSIGNFENNHGTGFGSTGTK